MSKNLRMEKLNQLIEPAKSTALEMIEEANRLGIYVCVVYAYRSIEEQNNLYARGRTKPGRKVTNARGGQSIHNYRLAWDLCPIVNGKLNWKAIPLFKKLGGIGKKCGATWGGNFKTLLDYGHFQDTGGLSLKDLQCGKRPTQPAKKKPQTVKYRFAPASRTLSFIRALQRYFMENANPPVRNAPSMFIVDGLIECTVKVDGTNYEKVLVEALNLYRGKHELEKLIKGHSYKY